MRQNTKTLIGLNSTATTAATVHTAQFDTLGFSFAKLILITAETAALPTSGFTLTESDTTGGTTNAVPGFTQNTDWTASTSTNATSTAKLIAAVDLRGRKRYLNATGATASVAPSAVKWIAELSNPGDGISNATEAGAANAVGI